MIKRQTWLFLLMAAVTSTALVPSQSLSQDADAGSQSDSGFYATVADRFAKMKSDTITGHAVDSKKPKEIAGTIRKQLAAAFDQHRMVIVGVPGHAMAAMSYERDSDKLQIWNPWGSSGNYKELDVKMQHGFFQMPVDEFVERCTNIMFELPRQAPNA